VTQQLRDTGNQKFLGEKVKVVDYIVAQKVIYFFSKRDGKLLMIYVAVKTHSPQNSNGKLD